jgi:BsuBI/PstI restriction endonuclease domain/BsuBI/PstI restriction endonuclease HTH domain
MSGAAITPVSSLDEIIKRLPVIFPEGTDHRNYLIRDIAARTIFVMLYIDAVEGRGKWIRPNQITRMTDRQSRKTDAASRGKWAEDSLKPGQKAILGRWYADNTREPIRDETIQNGLIVVGAVIERPNLPSTSAKPRYALAKDFAELFTSDGSEFEDLAEAWRARHLSAGALARVQLVQQSVARGGDDEVLVTFPNAEVRRMAPGPSSEISKYVIEQFARRFLAEPGVVFSSESRSKVVARDDQLARRIGLSIEAEKVLPDIVLVDLAPKTPLLVFVEVVASDGPISDDRKAKLLELTQRAGYDPGDVAFVTALLDRGPVYRKVASEIAWDSFVWFASEPDFIVIYRESVSGRRLSDLT